MAFMPLARKFQRRAHRWLNPVSARDTRGVVARLLGGGCDILFVHSSLSACGRFTAGAEDVLTVLRECTGTLGMPTHTYSYPDSGTSPAPVFDPVQTPSRNGILTELFRKQPGVLRSIHSTHSLAMTGGSAADLICRHYMCNQPAGTGTPYARMIERKASALMWGVTFHSYTFFHTAEDASGSQFAYEPETLDKLRVIDEAGVVRECFSRRQTRNPRRFEEAGVLLEQNGLVRSTSLGAGRLLFVPDCAKVHDFLIERLRKTPDFLFLSCQSPLV